MQIIPSIIAAITGRDIALTFLWLVVAGVVYWVVSWALGEIKLPEPLNKILKVIAVLATAAFGIYQLVELAQKA